ncbi:MAG: four helix bundle protein [Desulfobacula sp.]|uniref:four helix bundle protein n=1 Tax=Desulfobacula sp. TaxID=2593537 RepID=UPI0025C3068C|nr:four helix bundle protein [Desulfobacula sp.]MCD4720896.1 four helix bundle protein [Desulfobacula sp.]
MARYEHLPVYRKAMELAVYLQNTVRNFSRYNKYTIGTDLRDLSRKVIQLVIRANSARDREKILEQLVETCDMLKSMLVFAMEAKTFQNFKSFQHAAGLATILCRQSEGWLKSTRGRNLKHSKYLKVSGRANTHCAPPPPGNRA